MKRLIGIIILSFVLIAFGSPSFSGDKRKDKMKDKHTGNPFEEILEQITILNDKLDELLAYGVDLRGVTQNWDKKFVSTNGDANGCNSDRFTCIWPTAANPDGAAVRDNETGLVWQRFVNLERFEWGAAVEHCASKEIASRFGWHLPSIEQLASLLDNSGTGTVALPDGNPFVGIEGSNWWSATVEVNRSTGSPPLAWIVVTAPPPNGLVGTQPITPADRNTVICVRGGGTYDGQDVQRVIEALPN